MYEYQCLRLGQGLQALHLLSHTDGSGGLSSLVDGFMAAYKLRASYPRFYDILSRTGVYAHASGNDGISIQPTVPQPVLSHFPPDSPLHGELMQVRWNNADRAGLAAGFEEVKDWYEGAEYVSRGVLGGCSCGLWRNLVLTKRIAESSTSCSTTRQTHTGSVSRQGSV